MGADEEIGNSKKFEVREVVQINKHERKSVPENQKYFPSKKIEIKEDIRKYSPPKKNEIKEENETNKFRASNASFNINKKKDFKCTYDKNELLNKLNNFINQHKIQTKFFDKKNNLYDPVFESIQKEEKDGLIKFLK